MEIISTDRDHVSYFFAGSPKRIWVTENKIYFDKLSAGFMNMNVLPATQATEDALEAAKKWLQEI